MVPAMSRIERWLRLVPLAALLSCLSALPSCLGAPLELPAPNSPGSNAAGHEPAPPKIPTERAARAFVIEAEADLLTGPAAEGRSGDYELENGVVAFVVGRPDQAIGFADSGGHLIDAAPVGGQDALRQLFERTGTHFPRQVIYQRVEVLARGRSALLRASGYDSEDHAIEVVTDYRLEPGARSLEIDTTISNGGAKPVDKLPVGEAIQWGQVERFVPEQGFDLEAAVPRDVTTTEGWMLGVGAGVTYGYVVKGTLQARHGVGWSEVSLGNLTLPPGGSARLQRWLVVSATPDVGLNETISALRDEHWARIGGRVVEDGSSTTVDGARLVLADRNERAITVTRSQHGSYAQLAPPGDYLIGVEAAGRRGPQHLEVKLSAGAPTQLDVLLSRPGRLDFRVDEGGHPSPAKVTLVAVEPTRRPNLGPASASPGANIILSSDGRGSFAVPPGHYHAIASRGPAFTIDDKEVQVAPGTPAQLSFVLSRAVDLPGLTCADLHQHASPSTDSAVAIVDRVAANLAEGLDVEVATDHNMVADYSPEVLRLATAAPLVFIAGDEATREGVGHFNVWPATYHDAAPRGGALDVRGKDAHQIFAELRAADRVLQVNHPRVGAIGYFNLIGFDPLSATLPKDWEGGFDALEIFTGKDVASTDAPIADWMALANRGLVYTAVGGSDSHLIWGQEVGYPRTCLILDGAPTVEGWVAAIKQRHEALVTNGPFISVSVAGHGMGQLAPAPRGHARLEVEVRAAPWVDTRRLEIWVNGGRRGKPIDIPPGRAPLRYKGAVDLKVDRDSSVVVMVRGDATLEPVVSRVDGAAIPKPFAVTNPIFLDRDGDGPFTPPQQPAPRPGPTNRPAKSR